jgi:hypothetical protein
MPKGKKRHNKGTGGAPHRTSKRTSLGGLPFSPGLPSILPFTKVVSDAAVIAVKIQGASSVPDGEYAFFDAYCADPHCDCRVAYLTVWSEQADEFLAYISVGWEALSFYEQWMKAPRLPGMGPVDIKRPSLMPLMPQSRLAQPLLKVLRSYLEDPEHLELFTARYFQFKAQLAQKS